MKNLITQTTRIKRGHGWALGAVGAAALFAIGTAAYCDEPLSMAPPVQQDAAQTSSIDPASAGADNVFNWTEVPQDQQVPITRAVFDEGGYQLFDSAGETIVIPFADSNLYVMKFAVSDTGSMYFVNTGDTPVLYVPQDGYLENAAVPGAKWFPFTPDFQPATPVFLGCAPSWPAFVHIGWYPDMCTYGGYYCNRPVVEVGAVFPTVGLFIQFGGERFNDWDRYQSYCGYHPAPYTIHIVNRNIYNWSRPVYATNRVFADGWASSRTRQQPAGGRVFNGAGHPFYTSVSTGNRTQFDRFQPTRATATNKPVTNASRDFMGARNPVGTLQNGPGNRGGFIGSRSTPYQQPKAGFFGSTQQPIRSQGYELNRAPQQSYTQPVDTARVFQGVIQRSNPPQLTPQRSFQGLGQSSGRQGASGRSFQGAIQQNAPQRTPQQSTGTHTSPAPSQSSGGNDHGSTVNNRWTR